MFWTRRKIKLLTDFLVQILVAQFGVLWVDLVVFQAILPSCFLVTSWPKQYKTFQKDVYHSSFCPQCQITNQITALEIWACTVQKAKNWVLLPIQLLPSAFLIPTPVFFCPHLFFRCELTRETVLRKPWGLWNYFEVSKYRNSLFNAVWSISFTYTSCVSMLTIIIDEIIIYLKTEKMKESLSSWLKILSFFVMIEMWN